MMLLYFLIGFRTMEISEKFERAHQSIKQCIHQLNHLRKVWLDVLPTSNFCKTIGMFDL